MKEKLLTKEEVIEWINYEDKCGVNTLLQELSIFEKMNPQVFGVLNEDGELCDFILRDKNSGKACWDIAKEIA